MLWKAASLFVRTCFITVLVKENPKTYDVDVKEILKMDDMQSTQPKLGISDSTESH